jgi:membrane protease YdiL (CAAX protease family)
MSAPKIGERVRAIAPLWHTVGVLLFLAALAWLSIFLRMGSEHERVSNLSMYTIVIALEWALLAFCVWRSDAAFVGYVARVTKNPRALLWDIPVAVGLAGFLLLITPWIVRILGQAGFASMTGMFPKSGAEIALWIVMSITAGVCEETIFRGYLQQQFAGWTGSVGGGIVVQAALFGVCHGYQGWKKVALISIWGLVFGVCAWWRKGLRANMIAHACLDSLAIFGAR